MSSGFFPLSGLTPPLQPSLFSSDHSNPASIAITPQVSQLLSSDCAVAVSISGGKDSQACALRTSRYLDEIGHSGPRVLVNSDLGFIEWRDSLPSCQRLAAHLGIELIVVRRKAGDMVARWQQRWQNNVKRYRDLSCVRLILPWSTNALRFCTSELKVSPITAELKRRFPCHAILNVSGIRRQESAKRRRMPVSAIQAKLARKDYIGVSWNPIIEWTIDDVLAEIRTSSLPLHEAYTRYGSSRVSCAFCILSSAHDLAAASTCSDNHDVYRALVELEAESSFAFQGTRWLADVASQLLPPELIARIDQAKRIAEQRRAAESEIPKHLLYTKGWPTHMPTAAESQLIARVRRRVSEILALDAGYLTADSVQARYAELLEAKRKKDEIGNRKKRNRRLAQSAA